MTSLMNINTIEYWDKRFKSGNWGRNGRRQTLEYAMANCMQIELNQRFNGSLLDFGCALGDAIPVYKRKFPNAIINGYDISVSAIEVCRKKYHRIAEFFTGEFKDIPFHDIIIASHVMEHLNGDINVVRSLLEKCRELYIFVPYKESPLYIEHVNYYEDDYYNIFSPLSKTVFKVSYEYLASMITILKNAMKFKISLWSHFEKEIIMYHLQNMNL